MANETAYPWIACCISHCRRRARRERWPNSREIICGRCWRTIELKLRRRYATLYKRDRRIERLVRLKKIKAKPGFGVQIDALIGLFDRARDRNWEECKADATMKSNLRVEGTAGDLAARRAGR